MPTAQLPKLEELLAANASFITVYVMKASLEELWNVQDGWAWRGAWRNWLAMIRDSSIEPLIRFANRLALYWRGILARVRWPMHISLLEGIDNRIKVMKPMA